MRQTDTYYIIRDGIYAWLGTDIHPLPTDTIIEVRPLLIADDCMALYKDSECIGCAIWLKDTTQYDYTEDIIIEEVEEEEETIEFIDEINEE